MRSVYTINSLEEMNPNKRNIVIVKNASEIQKLKSLEEYYHFCIRLVINHVDEELVDLLISLNMAFEIVLRNNDLNEREMSLLHRFKESTNNKVYLAYDIDDSSQFDRVLMTYYINQYGIIGLLNTQDKHMYNEWAMEIAKYTKKQNVKKLNRAYIGTKDS